MMSYFNFHGLFDIKKLPRTKMYIYSFSKKKYKHDTLYIKNN